MCAGTTALWPRSRCEQDPEGIPFAGLHRHSSGLSCDRVMMPTSYLCYVLCTSPPYLIHLPYPACILLSLVLSHLSRSLPIHILPFENISRASPPSSCTWTRMGAGAAWRRGAGLPSWTGCLGPASLRASGPRETPAWGSAPRWTSCERVRGASRCREVMSARAACSPTTFWAQHRR